MPDRRVKRQVSDLGKLASGATLEKVVGANGRGSVMVGGKERGMIMFLCRRRQEGDR